MSFCFSPTHLHSTQSLRPSQVWTSTKRDFSTLNDHIANFQQSYWCVFLEYLD